MTVKIRLLYSYRDDHFAFRDASEHVYDSRDLDAAGNPPAWFLPQQSIAAELDEIEFDHVPDAAELAAAFKQRKFNA